VSRVSVYFLKIRSSINDPSREIEPLIFSFSKNILSNTSQRGRFGEIILETLISDYLPKNNYEFQKTLSNSCRVDCILKTNGNLNNLCIDA